MLSVCNSRSSGSTFSIPPVTSILTPVELPLTASTLNASSSLQSLNLCGSSFSPSTPGWVQDVLSKLCSSCPEPWDEYTSAACWIKRTLPDPNLSGQRSPFEILFGRKPQTSLDTLVPHVDDTETTGGRDYFVKQRRRGTISLGDETPAEDHGKKNGQRQDFKTFSRSDSQTRRSGAGERR